MEVTQPFTAVVELPLSRTAKGDVSPPANLPSGAVVFRLPAVTSASFSSSIVSNQGCEPSGPSTNVDSKQVSRSTRAATSSTALTVTLPGKRRSHDGAAPEVQQRPGHRPRPSPSRRSTSSPGIDATFPPPFTACRPRGRTWSSSEVFSENYASGTIGCHSERQSGQTTRVGSNCRAVSHLRWHAARMGPGSEKTSIAPTSGQTTAPARNTRRLLARTPVSDKNPLSTLSNPSRTVTEMVSTGDESAMQAINSTASMEIGGAARFASMPLTLGVQSGTTISMAVS